MFQKSHIPNHKEYYEARWFQQGIDINDEFINVCGSDVPFGTDLLFVDENDNDICFGIEICEDSVPVPKLFYGFSWGKYCV